MTLLATRRSRVPARRDDADLPGRSAKLPAYVGAPNERGGFSIYKVVKVITPPAADAPKLAAARARIGEMQNRELFDAYVSALKAKANVKINQAESRQEVTAARV